MKKNFRVWDKNKLEIFLPGEKGRTVPTSFVNGVLELGQAFEVMSSTGMKDVSNVKIYEEDICSAEVTVACINKTIKGKVVYNNDYGRYELQAEDLSVPLGLAVKIQILGNTYEGEKV